MLYTWNSCYNLSQGKWREADQCVQLFAILWTLASQAPPSMGLSRQEHQSGLPFPSPGGLPNPGIKPRSPALQADALCTEPPGKSNLSQQSFNRQNECMSTAQLFIIARNFRLLCVYSATFLQSLKYSSFQMLNYMH